ncbi:baseplate complex protein [Microbulbifer epialgicus]|uniref:DNA-binding protein n=1 Tax=Microbulbifer epialgicus TaxID=393907 RepID=A0ABV4NXT0_9GAMM
MRLNDFTLRGSELAVNGVLRIETESLGGNTSSSDRAKNGIKPKSLTVSLVITFENSADLSALIQQAESVDENGKLTVFDIVDETARSMNIRQVQFNEAFNVRKIPEKQAWRINFTLSEYLSIPEKVEQRQQTQTAQQQSANGEAVAAGSTEEQQGTENYTGFEKVLKFADDALAPDEEEGADAVT